MPTTCKIYFNNNEYIVHSGQKLIVTVRLKLTEEIKVRSINIHLHGRTHVHFIKDDCKKEGMYVADENVLDMKKCLDAGNGGEIQHMIPGTYDYTYNCFLPHNLPSSYYYGLWGQTTYTAQVTINVPRWPDKTFKESFHVHKLTDLNDFPSLQNSFTLQEELTVELKRECSMRCTTMYAGGPFNIVARMASGGYVPGQFINLKVEIDNNDRFHAIVIFHVRLLRRVIYLKSENSKHKKTTWAALVTKSASGCQIKQHRTLHVSLKVPCTQPTDTESKLIKIDYTISIIAEMGSFQKNLCVSFPVTIGTKRIGDASPPAVTNLSESKRFLPSAPPLRTQSSNVRFVEPSAPDDDTVSIRTYASTPPPFPDDEFDLPTYDEALQLDDEFNLNLDRVQYSFGQLYEKQ